jgi:DNA invertase Pin-like site-specific DNA recombinase
MIELGAAPPERGRPTATPPGLRDDLRTLADPVLFQQVDELYRRIASLPDETVSREVAWEMVRQELGAEYIRVSSERQAKRYGAPSQHGDIIDKVELQRARVPGIRFEDHISASGKMTRSDFRRMVKLRREGTFKVLWVGRIDRFARNEPQGWLYLYELILLGTWIVFCDENVIAGLEHGWEDVISRKLADSAAYVRLLRANIKKAVKERRRRGERVGVPPYGWRMVAGTKSIEFHPDEIGAVKRLVELLLLDQDKLRDIAAQLNTEGFRFRRDRPFTKSNVYDILLNPILIGRWRIDTRDARKTTVLAAMCPPLISEKEFAKLRAILSSRRYSKHSPSQLKRPYLFRGLLRCGERVENDETGLFEICGAPFACCGNRPRVGKPHQRYRHRVGAGCLANKPDTSWAVSEITLAKSIDREFSNASLPPEALQHIERYLNEQSANPLPDRAAVLAGFEQDRERFGRALVIGAYGRDSDIAQARYAADIRELDEKIAALPEAPLLPEPNEVLAVRDLGETWKAASIAERNKILSTMIEAIYITRDGGEQETQAGLHRQRGRQAITRIVPKPEYAVLLSYALSRQKLAPGAQNQLVASIDGAEQFLGWLRVAGRPARRRIRRPGDSPQTGLTDPGKAA